MVPGPWGWGCDKDVSLGAEPSTVILSVSATPLHKDAFPTRVKTALVYVKKGKHLEAHLILCSFSQIIVVNPIPSPATGSWPDYYIRLVNFTYITKLSFCIHS